MRITIHQEIPDDPALCRAWNSLVLEMDSPQVFYTYEWARALQHAYGGEARPWLLLGWDDAHLRGAAALTVDLEAHTARFLAGTTSDYCDFIGAPPQRQALLASTLEELRKAGIGNLTLANLPADSATASSIHDAARESGFHVFRRPAYECAQVKLGSSEERAAAKHSLDKKKMFRRNLHALEREGEVRMQHVRSPDELQRALPRFYEAHVGRFLATGRLSNLVSAQRRAFLSELARLLGERGWMKLSCLTVNDQAIAWNYGFEFNGAWFWYQPTLDSRYEEYSPGYCLLSKMVMEACDHPDLQLVDLGLGAEGYKERFANGTRETVDIALSSSPATRARVQIRYEAARAIKEWPRGEQVVRSAVKRLGSLQERRREMGAVRFVEWGIRRSARTIWSHDEVKFFEWVGAPTGNDDEKVLPHRLQPIDLNELARAALRYESDGETLMYLIRSAQRHRTPGSTAQGFVLTGPESDAVHFCWTAPFEGFFMDELKVHLTAPVDSAVMIFDCWTPRAARGHSYYARAIALLARELSTKGKVPWIFSAAANEDSLRGIAKASFEYRYSAVRDARAGWHRVTRKKPDSGGPTLSQP